MAACVNACKRERQDHNMGVTDRGTRADRHSSRTGGQRSQSLNHVLLIGLRQAD